MSPDLSPLPPRVRMIVAARMRGISVTRIAQGFGISHQAICSLVEKRRPQIEAILGEPFDYRAKMPCKLGKYIRTCEWCGKTEVINVGKVASQSFCSVRCAQGGRRRVSDNDVLGAIEMRQEGYLWREISRVIGHPMQTIQKNIWMYLVRNGRLNLWEVRSIWKPAALDRLLPCGWLWLENSTGRYVPIPGALS